MVELRRAAAALAGVAALVLALGGCTGVPTGGAPQTVEAVGADQESDAVAGPTPGTPAREIVTGFLNASTSNAVKHATAREYLTKPARNRWSDATVTIVADERVDVYDAARQTVTVSGRKVGSLDKNGVYTPTLDGTGHGGATLEFTFHLQQQGSQYRIAQLPPGLGLLLTEEQFEESYEQRALYFFDTSNQYLVPDVRYSPVINPQDVADWMLEQLTQGPNQALGDVVTSSLLAPTQRVTAKITGASTTVQVPGSSQLVAADRDRLAAQIGLTLNRALNVQKMTIMDGRRALTIPEVGGATFTANDFAATTGPRRPTPEVYYLRDGRLRTDTGAAVRGPFGNGGVPFRAVALARPPSIGALTVVGTQGADTAQRLYIGPQSGPARAVAIRPGKLTRPAWAPGRAEVWIGEGTALYRVTTNGRTSQVSQVQLPPVAGGGALVSVRLSPDGSRVALVVAGVGNKPQLYVGTVVRNGRTVQVDAPTQISPIGVVVQDVAWIDALKLYAIGYLRASHDAEVFRTNLDGANWDNLGSSNLPKPPDSITMAPGAASAWVSAQGYVWEQNGSSWVSPVSSTGQTQGTNPIFLG